MAVPGSQASPCVRRCCLDGDECLGCGRLMQEILDWPQASDSRQRQILDAAARRRAARAGSVRR
ncbi:DUF1289 domain-containing protein [Pseudomonas sp.]|uniref:DUF1289 domain-containing protein n=1 Tax=Pseudomonas sp. TaxID=306 RepID=UPI00272D2A5D|nr:DUF1289 domain-containing protein [Pseudomonas sp.]